MPLPGILQVGLELLCVLLCPRRSLAHVMRRNVPRLALLCSFLPLHPQKASFLSQRKTKGTKGQVFKLWLAKFAIHLLPQGTPSSSRESSRGVMPAIRAQDLLRAGLDFWTQKPAEQSPETLHSVTPSPEDLSPTDRLLRALRRSYSRQPQDTDELCCQCFPGKLI